MKNKLAITFVVASLLLSSCASNENQDKSQSILSDNSSANGTIVQENESVLAIAKVLDNGEYEYIEVKADSIKIFEDKIEGLNTKPFEGLPDIYAVSSDGEILCDYAFIAVTVVLKSEIDREVCLTGFRLEAGDESIECFYNDSPIEGDSAKRSGYTQLTANIDKTVTIGFFVSKDMITLPDFILNPIFVYTGKDGDKITIKNPGLQ